MTGFSSRVRTLLLTIVLLLARPAFSAVDPGSFGELGVNLGGIAYWSHPPFANALWSGEGWLEYSNSQWGSTVYFQDNPQFDTNGFPKYLNPGLKLRAVVFALHANPAPRPSSWPDRTALARGKVVIAWKGDADIRANGGVYLNTESSGAQAGRLVNGRRVYRFTGTDSLQWITVEDINASAPLTDIKVWLPDPADPDNRALENQLIHPTYLRRLNDVPWTFLRFMDWNDVSPSPQRDWADRRLPAHAFQQGILNRRSPANGFAGDRGTGVAFEWMVAVCNATGRDMWINVPHLASDDYITNLARLLRFGSDGVNPYSNAVANPAYPPLDKARRVFVEYSNEIWSSGDAFCEGNWAQDQANALGITKPQFNARRFCDVWRLFRTVFAAESNRVIRVAAVWTGLQSYTDPFLAELAAYGPGLNPPQTPDVIAPTTYFGNGIQDWAYAKAQQQAGTADPWFLTTNTFTDGSTVKPVSVPATDPYWTGTNVLAHASQTFVEWKRLLLSGATQTGGGPDATGIGGGFDWWLRSSISNAFGAAVPILSYEGGPSIYTDYLDGGDTRDDGITTFLELLNRQPQMADVYRIHLNQAKAKGLRTHGEYVDISSWGKYGQWGHLEYLDQDPATSVKWNFIRNWQAEVAGLQPIDQPVGAVPQFTTAASLPTAVYGQSYSQDITVTNGDGALTLKVIDSLLSAGLTVTNLATGPPRLRVSGIPLVPGDNYIFARVNDSDGDPAWRTFYFRTAGGPGTILECNFSGVSPALSLPWTAAYSLKSGLAFAGWTKGAGISAASGNDGLVWSQNMPADEPSSTLGLALTNNTYWQCAVTIPAAAPLNLRKAEARFTIRRIDYHAPREYALFTSVSGFTNGAQVCDTGRFTDTTDREFVFTLPDTPAYSNLTGVLTFRIYGYSGQYAGHRTSLRAFKLTADSATLSPFDQWKIGFGIPTTASNLSDPDNDGLPLLLEYALGLSPVVAETNGLPSGAISNACLTLTYNRVKAATDISYWAESSGSLQGGWSASSSDVDQAWSIADHGSYESVTARDRTPVTAGGSRFMRLRVTQN